MTANRLARALTWPLDLAARLVTIPADAFRLVDDAMDVWCGDEERGWEE